MEKGNVFLVVSPPLISRQNWLKQRRPMSHLYDLLRSVLFLVAVLAFDASTILAQAANGLFGPPTLYSSGAFLPYSVTVGDFNGDGKLDLAVANRCGSPCARGIVSVRLGNGDGTFQAAVSYDSGANLPTWVTAGDFNGDGKLDLAVANNCANGNTCPNGVVGILLGNGDGTFQAAVPYYSGGNLAYSVTVGDFNGDGKLDLAVANNCSFQCPNGSVSVLLGNGDGTFRAAVPYNSGGNFASSVTVGDFNGDGKLDLAVGNQSNGTVGVLLGNGDGTFQTAQTFAVGTNPSCGLANDNGNCVVVVGDFNGDGKPDLAVANSGSNNVSVLLGNGDGTFQTAVTYGSGGGNAFSVAVGEVNGDGKPDLLIGNGNGVGVLLGNGDGTFQTAVTYSSGGDAFSVVVGDMNGDRKLDLLVGNQGASTVGVLLNISGPPPAIIMIPPAPLVSSTGFLFDSPSWSNGYGSFNLVENKLGVKNHMYHTGLDIGGEGGKTVVVAAADGIVKAVFGLAPQGGGIEKVAVWDDTNNNGIVDLREISNLLAFPLGCKPKNCKTNDNHGFGMAILISHDNNSVTLYGHLDAIRRELYDAVIVNGGTYSVTKGQPIAVLGNSAYDNWQDPTFLPHVHFEVKEKLILKSPRSDFNVDTNGNMVPVQYFGYTPDHPDSYGYSDPFLSFSPPPNPAATSAVIKIIDEEGGSSASSRGIRVYTGPGVKYSVMGWTGLGVSFVSDASALSTTPGDDENNRLWYRITIPQRLGPIKGWVASHRSNGAPLVQEDPSATVLAVINDGGVGWRLKLDPTKDCGIDPSNCVRVWDDTYTVYRNVRAWNGLRFVSFSTQQISGTNWSAVYIPKFHFVNPRTTSAAAPYHDNVVGEIRTVWLGQDAVAPSSVP